MLEGHERTLLILGVGHVFEHRLDELLGLGKLNLSDTGFVVDTFCQPTQNLRDVPMPISTRSPLR